jgi:type II secretory pathway pseudopilin PulG
MRAQLTRRRRSSRRSDRGDTLVELLIATLVMSITAAALINSLISSSTSSVEHRSLASLDGVLRSFAESATYEIQMQGAGSVSGPLYAPCALPSSYQLLSAPTPASGPSGSTVTVFVTGLSPSVPLQPVTLKPVPSGTATTVPVSTSTDGNGDATVTFTIPTGLAAGAYSVAVSDGVHTARSNSDFVVTSSGTPTTSTPLDQYHLQVSHLSWWMASAKAFQSPPTVSQATCKANDTGMQQLTLTATAQNGTNDNVSLVVTDPGSEYPQVFSPYGATLTFHFNTPSSYTLQTSGFPQPTLSCALCSTSLPSSITFDGSTGVLSGTPVQGDGDNSPYTITITSSNTPIGSTIQTTSQTFTVVVDEGPTVTSLDSATYTAPGVITPFRVTADGTPPITFSCWKTATGGGPSSTPCSANGVLPHNLSFSGNTLSGTLSNAAGTGGVYYITFTATNQWGTISQDFTLTINQAPVFTNPAAAKTVTFSKTTGGSFTAKAIGYPTTPPYPCSPAPASVCYAVNGLPPWATFNQDTGVLKGTPPSTDAVGKLYKNITFTATNSTGSTTSQKLTIKVGA